MSELSSNLLESVACAASMNGSITASCAPISQIPQITLNDRSPDTKKSACDDANIFEGNPTGNRNFGSIDGELHKAICRDTQEAWVYDKSGLHGKNQPIFRAIYTSHSPDGNEMVVHTYNNTLVDRKCSENEEWFGNRSIHPTIAHTNFSDYRDVPGNRFSFPTSGRKEDGFKEQEMTFTPHNTHPNNVSTLTVSKDLPEETQEFLWELKDDLQDTTATRRWCLREATFLNPQDTIYIPTTDENRTQTHAAAGTNRVVSPNQVDERFTEHKVTNAEMAYHFTTHVAGDPPAPCPRGIRPDLDPTPKSKALIYQTLKDYANEYRAGRTTKTFEKVDLKRLLEGWTPSEESKGDIIGDDLNTVNSREDHTETQ